MKQTLSWEFQRLDWLCFHTVNHFTGQLEIRSFLANINHCDLCCSSVIQNGSVSVWESKKHMQPHVEQCVYVYIY
jgi:hypothetical protein